MKNCYQCDRETAWLAPDSRCTDCTRMTPEEVRGTPEEVRGEYQPEEEDHEP